MRRTVVLALVASCALLLGAQGERRVVRVATSTSVAGSGLLDRIAPLFEQQTGYRIKVLAVGSGRALHLGQQGEADAVISHAPQQERDFVASGFGARRYPFMRNRYVIAGPEGDPARVRDVKTAPEALRAIAAARHPFLSRGDDSGTHQSELALWRAAGIQPGGEWYLESGLNARDTLQKAIAQRAYTLVDVGIWNASGPHAPLAILVSGGPELESEYSILTMNPAKVPAVNHEGARALVAWILSPAGRRTIESLQVDGVALFQAIPAR